MKVFFIGLLFVLVISCNHNDSKRPNIEIQSGKDSSSIKNSSVNKDSALSSNTSVVKTYSESRTSTKPSDSNRNAIDGKLLMILSSKILRCLKEKSHADLAIYIHPKLKVRFSPYAYVDTIKDRAFSPNELLTSLKSQNLMKWGYYDGTEKNIKLSVANYTTKFVYDVDFLHAEKKAINKSLAGGIPLII